MRTTVIVFFSLVVGALAGLVHIDSDLGQTLSSYTSRDYIFDDIVFDVDQNFNDASKGDVAIYARSIIIPSGVTISARGTGAYGGGGGGGGGGRDGWDGVGGAGKGGYRHGDHEGVPEASWGQDGNPGAYGGSWGNGGKGGEGGAGQTFADGRSESRYPYSEATYKGNGGKGGAGGRGGGGESWSNHDEEGAGGGGGGGGGRGGGSISLFAANRIFVGGKITSEGSAGGAGGSKGDRTKGILRYGGAGGDGGKAGQAGGSGGKGYAGDRRGEENGKAGDPGHPGDILLACYSGDVEVHGALYANTLKVFHGGVYINTSGAAGTATVWTNTYSNVTEWAYAADPEFLSIPTIYVDQPACEADVTVSGTDYIVTAKYTNTVSLFSTNDVASPRGDGNTNVTFETTLKFVVPQATGTKTFTDGVAYGSAYTNGIKGTAAAPVIYGAWWRMVGADGTYEQTSSSYFKPDLAVRGTVAGQSVCASNHVVSGVTNYGPASITITVSGNPPSATVPALPNFWLFPSTMLRYDDSVPAGYTVTNEIVTNKWSVGQSFTKEMNGDRPRQSWQSNSTREWPMPNQESGWQ